MLQPDEKKKVQDVIKQLKKLKGNRLEGQLVSTRHEREVISKNISRLQQKKDLTSIQKDALENNKKQLEMYDAVLRSFSDSSYTESLVSQTRQELSRA